MTRIVLFCVMLSAAAVAGAVERYQAVVIQEGSSPRVFILDTREGHMWTWTETIRGTDQELRYEGRVRPGGQVGDIIQKHSALNQQRSRRAGTPPP